MKKYILIYAYANFCNAELKYWNDLSLGLKKKGFNLVLLSTSSPKGDYNFISEKFVEKLDDVLIPQTVISNKSNEYYSKYLEREEVWYRGSKHDRLSAAKVKRARYIRLLNALNPCFVLIANGHHASEMILIDEIKERKIPHGFFERGCLTKSWHYDDFGITAGTEIANKSIDEIVLPESGELYDKFKVSYLSQKESWWFQPAINTELNIRKKYNINSKTKLILFANQLDNDTSNFLYSPFFNSNIEAFSWFLSSIKEVDCFVVAKKHPWYMGENNAFNNAFKEFDVAGKWVDDISLFDCLEQCDFVCAVNSTVVYEAMIFEKPVLQMGKSLISNKNILYELKNINDLSIIYDWLDKEGFENKLDVFSKFMSYMIEKELSFFLDSFKVLGFQNFNLILEKILERADNDRCGDENLSFGMIYNKSRKGKVKSFIKNLLKIFKL